MSSLTGFVRKLSLRRSKPKKKKTSAATAAEAAESGYNTDSGIRTTATAATYAGNGTYGTGVPGVPPSVITVGTVQREPRPLILGTQLSRSEASVRRKEWSYENIILQRAGKGLGFNIAGGTDNYNNEGRVTGGGEIDNCIYVTKIIEGGVAALDGRLRLNDIIVSVNETSYNGLTHGEAVDVLRNSGNRVKLSVKRLKKAGVDDGGPIEIFLVKNGRGLGFNISGGTDDQYKDGDDRIYVTKITEGGVAHMNGCLRLGDRILYVNDTSLEHVTHEKAVSILKSTQQEVLLVIDRDVNNNNNYKRSKSVEVLSRNGPTSGPGLGAASGLANGPGREPVNGPINGPGLGSVIGLANGPGRGPVSRPVAAVVEAAHDGRGRLGTTESSVSSGSDETSTPPDTPVYAASRVMTAAVPAAASPTVAAPAVTGRRLHATAAQAVNGSREWDQLVPEITNSDDMPNFIQEPRQISLRKRLSEGLGLNIVGGRDNAGIFISSIKPGSVADINGKLKRGDQILSVNGVNLRNATHEEAAAALKAVGETAVIIVQYRLEEFNYLEQKIRELHARQVVERGTDIKLPVLQRVVFYRALTDYDSSRDPAVQYGKGMSYEFGDILHVIIPQDGSDWWQARRVVPHRPSDQQSGIIPSRRKLEERNGITLRPKGQDNYSEDGRETITREKKRRSFILSRKISFNSMGSKPKKSSSSDGPAENTAAAVAAAMTPGSPGQVLMYYQPVVQMQRKYARPIIILGVMKEQINNSLIVDYPDRFASCVPHTTRPKRRDETDGLDYHFVSDRRAIEKEIEDNKFIEVGVYLDHLYAMSLESVLTVAKQNKHCILDVTVNAVPRLESMQLYPITILVKPISSATVSLLHRPIAEETSRRIHQSAVKIYEESKQLLTAVVTGNTAEEIYTKVKEIIWMNSESQIWVNSNDPAYFI